MIICNKCKGRMFVDRQYNTNEHLEIFCVLCGSRTFFHPPSESEQGRWILQKEKFKAKNTITNL